MNKFDQRKILIGAACTTALLIGSTSAHAGYRMGSITSSMATNTSKWTWKRAAEET